MKQPEDVQLSREEGEALIGAARSQHADRRGSARVGKVLTFYFWLLFALREAKLSLKRIKALVFGEKPKPPKPPSSDGTASGGSAGGSATPTSASHGVPASASRVAAREEAASAGAWAAGRRGVSCGADGGMSP